MIRLRGLLVPVLLLALAIPVCAQQVKVSVQPDRTGTGTLTGDYYAKVTVEGAGTARQVVFRLNFPAAYGLNQNPSDIQIVAVRPGADVMSIDANDVPTADPSDDTPVVFAEAVSGSPTNGVWIVALMKDEAAKTTKHVCDIVFTSRGRATKDPVAFEAGSVSVKDASLAVLSNQGVFGTSQVPLFGDVNWDSKVNALDFAVFVQAWREYNQSGFTADKALADLAPRSTASGVIDPAEMLSSQTATPKAINALDFTDFVLSWREYNKTQTTAAPQTAPKEESQ
jgi:hypothetical protein